MDIELTFKIDALACERQFEFKICEAKDSAIVDWLRVLDLHHKTSKGYTSNLTSVSIKSKFWKTLR